MDKIRILHIGLWIRVYGTERVVLNLYQAIDREQYQFDFLIDHKYEKLEYENEITELGGKVYYQYYSVREKNVIGYISPEEFLEQHPEICGVHLHASDYCFSQFRYVMAAQKKGLSVRIIHSHNSQMIGKAFKSYVNRWIVLALLKKYGSGFLACSSEAGKWNFGKLDYEILPNGVDTDRFAYNGEIRERLRKRYHLENKLVLGFAGRLEDQKNPEFLLKVLKEVNKRCDHALLLLLGEGDLGMRLKNKVAEEKLENVLFMGRVDNVKEWFQAFDVLLLPSIFEGLGLVLIEAQANGLMCFASEYVPKESAVTGRIAFLSLERAKDWADKILETDFSYDRKRGRADVAAAEYDIKSSAKRLGEIYRETMIPDKRNVRV